MLVYHHVWLTLSFLTGAENTGKRQHASLTLLANPHSLAYLNFILLLGYFLGIKLLEPKCKYLETGDIAHLKAIM